MAYFPASCDYDCIDCSQNKCGWCAFLDRPCGYTLATTINPYDYSTTITGTKNDTGRKINDL